LHPRLRNSARNLALLSYTDLGGGIEELRLGVEALRAEIGQLRGEIARACQREETLDQRIEALSSRLTERVGGLGSALRGDYYELTAKVTAGEYWTRHNVTMHRRFGSVEESLRELQYRNQAYPGYIDLLPVSGKDDLTVLDYGCGPGHDLVGFVYYSRPKRLVGVDISASSLAEAEHRLHLHGARAELIQLAEGTYDLPFEASSFDYIHSSGVLMCIDDPPRLLREFRRILKPGGELRLMVYNYDSIWLHLYVAYVVQLENGLYADLPPRIAFTRTTDGEDCPINAVWRPEEMLALGRDAGFEPVFLGAAMSLWEMHTLPRRHLACLDPRLPDESREFLLGLRLDPQGQPWHREHRAGIDGCFQFRRAG
jgi:SAM-dependent methyltransferase